jgi:hypothetical protein
MPAEGVAEGDRQVGEGDRPDRGMMLIGITGYYAIKFTDKMGNS